jgi:beta-glucosidase
VDLRVRDLLSRMTLEEKVGQIIALWATKAQIMDDLTFSPQGQRRLSCQVWPDHPAIGPARGGPWLHAGGGVGALA